jgi:hypothetical protein
MKQRASHFSTVFRISIVLEAALISSACASDLSEKKLALSNPAAYNSTAVPGKTLLNMEDSLSINGKLPEHVYIATRTQTFASGYEFCLSGGRIMMKKKNGSGWELFQKTGLPFSTKAQLPGRGWFLPPESVREIAADDDTLIAFDNFGRMYVCPLVKNHLDKKFAWSCTFGWPDKEQLVQNKLVENKLGWATGTRRGNIKWYTDRFGNEHHWGTMGVTTVYFLTKNGQEIRFTDSGLPADFSKTILGPERGSFIAENISASGSTIFLIDRTGAMYTRLIDYDTMGCDPMFFKYTYTAEKQPYKGSDYRSNFTPWGLPNEDWRRQPPVPLRGMARLTKYICIFQNGRGNDARVLRIAGMSPDGTTGYYWKNLTDNSWQFEKAKLLLPASSFLPAEDRGRTVRGNKNEYAYSGIILKDNKTVPGVSCSISDMTLTSEGSCTLTITKGAETKSVPLYLVEMWTFMKRYDPVFDNTPKSFFVTPHFSDTDISSADPDLNALLSALFSGRNLDLFSASATATGSYLAFDFSSKESSYTLVFQGKCTSEGTFAPLLPVSSSGKPETPGPALTTGKTYTAADVGTIDAVAESTNGRLQEIEVKSREYKEKAAVTQISRWGYTIADTLAALTLLNQVDIPKIKTITSFGGQLMKQNANNFHLLSEYKSLSYPYEVQLGENTLSECRRLKARILSSGSAETDRLYRSNYPEYFTLIGLPQTVSGTLTSGRKKTDASVNRIDSEAKLPVLLVTYGSDENQFIMIEFTSLISDVYSCMSASGSAPDKARPFTAGVRYHILSTPTLLFGQIRIDGSITSRQGTCTWDGNRLSLTVEQPGETPGTLFEGSIKEVRNDN